MAFNMSRNTSGPNQGPNVRLHGTLSPAICQALSKAGEPCQRILQDARHRYCGQHFRECKKLHELYKTQEAKLETLRDEDEEKIVAMEEIWRLRTIQTDRFFDQNRDEGRRGHAQWRLLHLDKLNKLKATKATNLARSRGVDETLAATVAKSTNSESSQQATEAKQSSNKHETYRSLMDPEVPMEALNHLPRDHLTVIFKELFSQITNNHVEKIYHILPSLNDSEATLLDPETGNRREPDKGELVLRYYLREFLIWKADPATLDRARRTQSIDTFLRQSDTELLEQIRRFLECFGRDDTLHFLRDAVYDLLHSSSSPTSPTIVLGAAMPLEDDKDRRMSVEAWDIIFNFFGNMVGWCQLGQLCFSFDDLLLAKRMTVLRRYDFEATGQNGAKWQKWYDPDNDVALECGLAVMQGFLALAKGFSDPPYTPITMESGRAKELESRNYLVGRIGTSHPLINEVIQELKDRVAQVIVRDYDAGAFKWAGCISLEDDGDDVWITRTRSDEQVALLPTKPWEVEWSLSKILKDICFIRRLVERESLDDCRYVIIIDRLPGKAFQLFQIVASAFLKVAGYPAPRVFYDNFIRAVLPDEEQSSYEKSVVFTELTSTSLTAHEPHYEGSRVRDWTILDRRSMLLDQDTHPPSTLAEIQLTAHIVGDMESQGLVTKLKTYEPPFSRSILYQASDGQYDVFFHYETPETGPSVSKNSPANVPSANPPPNALDAFARSYQAAHPNAVFAKGTIHVHYCAWPLPWPQDDALGVFVDPEGHLYRWNVLPFDRPFSPMSWQRFVHRALHAKLPFVRFLRTTFVICAETSEAAEDNLRLVEQVSKEQNWNLSVRDPKAWSSDLDALTLNSIWKGISEA